MFNPCCCCPILAIVISNSNSARDDNFEVFLNGTSLGSIDNNSSASCTGRIFCSDTGPTCANISGGASQFCDSGVCDFEALLTFDRSIVIVGTNTLQIRSTQNNLNGNFGKVKVLCLNLDGATYNISKTLLSTTYSDGSRDPPNTVAISTPTFTYP